MASKLELVFSGTPQEGQNIRIRSGVTFTFVNQRQGAFQVSTSQDILTTAKHFRAAYNTDENYLNDKTVTLSGVGDNHVLTIEHPNNNYFDDFLESTTFVSGTVTTTEEETEPTLKISFGQADNNLCDNFKLNISTNQVGEQLIIELPAGNKIHETTILQTEFSIDFPRSATGQTGYVKVPKSAGNFNQDPRLSRLYQPPTGLSITSVSVKSSPFGAIATINAFLWVGLNNPIQYSLDGVNYSGSKEYSGLLAGYYTAYVKDNFGCIKSKGFTITEAQTSGLSAEPYIEMPIHNSIRFAKRTGNNFLNYLSTETPGHIEIYHYEQPWKVGDIVTQQFRSAYQNHRLVMMDCQGNETEIPVIKKTNNISRVNILEGNYTEKEGRLAIYFTSGNIYNPDGSIQEEGHILEGRLPIWYEEGMYLNIEGIGVTQVERIFIDSEGIRYAITQTDSIGEGTNKKMTSIHSEHPYEVYEFEVNYLVEGSFQLRLEYWNDEKEFFLSEIQEVYEELPETFLKVEWWSENNNSIFYSTGIRHFRWIEWEKYFTLIPKTEKETFDTDTTVELLNSKSFAVYELILRKMPMEVARGVQTGFDNSGIIVINGAVFVCEEPVTLEKSGEWYYPTAQLTLTDQTIVGQQQITGGIEGRFLAVNKDANGVTFLRL